MEAESHSTPLKLSAATHWCFATCFANLTTLRMATAHFKSISWVIWVFLITTLQYYYLCFAEEAGECEAMPYPRPFGEFIVRVRVEAGSF